MLWYNVGVVIGVSVLLGLSCVRRLTTASGSTTTATVWERSTSTTLVHSSTSSGVSISSISISLGSAGLDVDGLSGDLMGVSSSGSLVALGGSIFYKSAVLRNVSRVQKIEDFKHTLERLTSK